MPRSDRLREWYLSMLRASKEKGVVTHLSNLYDTFFEGGRDHREKASSSAMPYLDGVLLPASLTLQSRPLLAPLSLHVVAREVLEIITVYCGAS